MDKLLAKGAEAEIFTSNYIGLPCIVKKRVVKGYRQKKLDDKIRKKRTVLESSLITKTKNLGIKTPFLYKIDKQNGIIYMELIKGKKLKDSLSNKNLNQFLIELGKIIGKLHSGGIIHGDLTTSNIIVRNNELVLIDFGLGFLSNKQEDMAVDLLNLKKTFIATHPKFEKNWIKLENAYYNEFKTGKKILKKIQEIEKRGRYL